MSVEEKEPREVDSDHLDELLQAHASRHTKTWTRVVVTVHDENGMIDARVVRPSSVSRHATA